MHSCPSHCQLHQNDNSSPALDCDGPCEKANRQVPEQLRREIKNETAWQTIKRAHPVLSHCRGHRPDLETLCVVHAGIFLGLEMADRLMTPLIFIAMVVGILVGEFSNAAEVLSRGSWKGVSVPLVVGLLVMMCVFGASSNPDEAALIESKEPGMTDLTHVLSIF